MDKSLILNKLKKYFNLKNDKEFAEFLDIKQNTFLAWKSRKSFDYDVILTKCNTLDSLLILTNKEELLKQDSKPIKTPFNQSLNTNDIELLKELLNTKDGLINSQQETITAQQKLIKELEEKIKLSK